MYTSVRCPADGNGFIGKHIFIGLIIGMRYVLDCEKVIVIVPLFLLSDEGLFFNTGCMR
jgi:hypothetical protein